MRASPTKDRKVFQQVNPALHKEGKHEIEGVFRPFFAYEENAQVCQRSLQRADRVDGGGVRMPIAQEGEKGHDSYRHLQDGGARGG
jgi:hypothetical protein